MGGITVDVVDAGALSAAERQAWAAFLVASPHLRGPFFSFDFTLAASRLAPGASVAVARRSGQVLAFLPFQARGRALLPLGAPLADYHGLIAAPDCGITISDLLRRLDATRFRSTGWIGPLQAGRGQERLCMAADLSQGYDAWAEGRRSTLKDKGRRMRALARDHGEPTVLLDDPDPDAVEWLFRGKRSQYALTDQHDVFACGWTGDLVRNLWRERGTRFGAHVATMRIEGRIIAAEASLRAGDVRHLWFPFYDRDFARYSPGVLLLLEQLRGAPGQGVKQVDFGPDVEGYKIEFADPAGSVFEGSVLPSDKPVEMISDDMFARWRLKAERRFDVIRACEPSWSRSATASLDSLAALGRRRLTQAGVQAGAPLPALIDPGMIALPLASL